MLGLSRVESHIRPLRRMVTGRADVYRVQSSSLRTGVKEIVTRFATVGLTQRQIRRVLASGSHRAGRDAPGRRCGKIPTRHEGYAANEENGHRNAQAGL